LIERGLKEEVVCVVAQPASTIKHARTVNILRKNETPSKLRLGEFRKKKQYIAINHSSFTSGKNYYS
jgi:hypothetical protein